ncbi:Conserved_hypothetical protein [Hexamita inflata]|uniref:Uncharacterized protein n=1 Tax=Hexamita inflata TaxID=28002 RepID=A0AA86UB04_9EUKA|nr:Conserved hypothetical protein [Hexamita inflata]
MPYNNLRQFIDNSGYNVTKVYEFESNDIEEPAIVPVALANEIMDWLNQEAKNQQIFTTTYQSMQTSTVNSQMGLSQTQFKKTFYAPK